MAKRKLKRRKKIRMRKAVRTVLLLIIAVLIVVPFLMKTPELPAGLSVASDLHPIDEAAIKLLIDTTAFDTNTGERVISQQIFDQTLELIEEAAFFVYVDFFLWNSWQGALPEDHRDLANELASALIKKKRTSPSLTILVATDPINRIYGGMEEMFYQRMVDANIPVVFTDLGKLPDSNALYAKPAAFYGRLLCSIPPIRSWLTKPRVANPFDPEGDDISLLQLGRLLRFKANHRKVVVADNAEEEVRLLVTSFNPANGSSAHSNMGLLLKGQVAKDAILSELEAAKSFTDNPDNLLQTPRLLAATAAHNIRVYAEPPDETNTSPAKATAQWVTEGKIKEKVIEILDDAGPRDDVRIAIFYLSDRDVVRAIKDSAYGGADVRVILDPNRDAFGRVKNGVPNRPVAAELLQYAESEGVKIDVRWADTHGEQFHTKALSVSNDKTSKHRFTCGSANWTRRNIAGLNMEANVALDNAPEIVGEYNEYFDTLWSNSDGLSHTVDYEVFADTGWRLLWKKMLYRIQESTGLSTF